MKKILFLIILCLGLFTACKKEEPRPMLLPTDVLSLEEAQAIVGDDYTLIMKDNAIKQEENLLCVKYLSEPSGTGDSIFVNLLTEDSEHDANSIKEEFVRSRNMRSDRILVQGLGDDAYITYPSLHLYSNGVYVEITAGSGGSDTQANLLVELGKLAEKNIDEYFNLSRK